LGSEGAGVANVNKISSVPAEYIETPDEEGQTSWPCYLVNFTIPFETKFGQSVGIVGSVPELGEWREYKCHL
jgi:hypothetical protein